jgi:hypothetical protein
LAVFAGKGGEMTRLRMHWKLVQEADGKKFLGMHWESEQAG